MNYSVITYSFCTQDGSSSDAGQVQDNEQSGQLLIHWSDNTISSCWPQDIYKFGPDDVSKDSRVSYNFNLEEL